MSGTIAMSTPNASGRLRLKCPEPFETASVNASAHGARVSTAQRVARCCAVVIRVGGLQIRRQCEPRPRPDVRVQPGAVSCKWSGGRSLPEENGRATLDRARFQRQRETEEIATILR